MTVAFRTPGLIDMMSIEVFGLNAKPNTDTPIGYFGTGLKYAIAVLLRKGCQVVVWRGNKRHEFVVDMGSFRGKDFSFIEMKASRGLLKNFTASRMPFTTDHGKNWDLWQAFRELESNTRDEKGRTEVSDHPIDKFLNNDTMSSMILVEDPKGVFDDIANNWRDVFLPVDELELRLATPFLQIFNNASKHVYYRGLRVYDMNNNYGINPKNPITAKYTYNLLSYHELTEDRTLKYTFYMYGTIAKAIAECDDEKLIESIVSDKEKFESRIDFDMANTTPGKTFAKVVDKLRRPGGYISSRVSAYIETYTRSEPTEEESDSLAERLQDWFTRNKRVVAGADELLFTQCITALTKWELHQRDNPEPIDDPEDEPTDEQTDESAVAPLEKKPWTLQDNLDQEVPF